MHALRASPSECHNIHTKPCAPARVVVPSSTTESPPLTTMLRRLDSPVAPGVGYVVEQRAGVACYLLDSSIIITRSSVLIPMH